MVKIRAKKCKLCNHITGLTNEQCEECDSTDLIVIEYEAEQEDQTGLYPFVRWNTEDFGNDQHLQANSLTSGHLDGHEMEIIEVQKKDKQRGLQVL